MRKKSQKTIACRKYETRNADYYTTLERAQKIEESTVLNLLDSPDFTEKTPFPSLERLHLSNWNMPMETPKRKHETIHFSIVHLMHAYRNIRVSQHFYSLSLEKTASLRSLELLG